MTAARTYVGIDVAKAKLDVASDPPGLTTTTPNTEAGIHALVPQVQALAPDRIVVEATGGYELPVVRALVEAALPVIVVNPQHVRDFAKATGQLAKTDTLDAQVLALVACMRKLLTILNAMLKHRTGKNRCMRLLNLQTVACKRGEEQRHWILD